jgi:hypothetical protein
MHEREWPAGSPEAALQARHLSGRKLPAGPDRRNHLAPEGQLVAAILLQALADAWAGQVEAIEWMDECAPVFGQWLDLDPQVLAAWRSVPPRELVFWDPAEFADVWA